jgi:hypothetical protein
MNDIRAKFEEIWPVPSGIYWDKVEGQYMPIDLTRAENDKFELACEWDSRLDTFTRCQETTDVYVSLVEELIASLDHHWTEIPNSVNKEITRNRVDRAKKILGR